jgi:hypothetical protein
MLKTGWVSMAVAAAVFAGAGALVSAQKGSGKGGKEPSRVAAEITISCPDGVQCGILGDGLVYGPSDLKDGSPGASLNMNKELNLQIGVIAGVPRSITLDFRGQRPQDLESAPADCSAVLNTCLWNWTTDVYEYTSGFFIQNNTLDPNDVSGETDLANGLLGLTPGTETLTRFNMSITSAGDGRLWRFNYNPNIPPTGQAHLAKVKRVDECTWVFSALDGERAALSVIYNPPKGKSYVHHEGRFEMPFELTFRVPSLCPAA